MSRNSRIAAAVLLAAAFAILFSAATDAERTSLTMRGDFPAFYAAGHIILTGRGASLYDSSLQREIENHFWPSLGGEYYSFAYPPYVAALLSPFALLPPTAAKALFTALMLLALWGCTLFARRILPWPAGRLPLFAAFISFAPLFIAVLAGQNSSLSMLLFALMLYSSKLPLNKRSFLLGTAVGLWAFKPQFAVCGMLLLLLAGEVFALVWAMLPLTLYYLLGAIVQGFSWPIHWLDTVSSFAEADFEANRHQMISLLGLAKSAADWLPQAAPLLLYCAAGLSLLLLLQAGWLAFWFKSAPEANKRSGSLTRLIALLGPLALLVSPHTLFYELGLCVLAVAACLERPLRLPLIIGIWGITALVSMVHTVPGIEPLAAGAFGAYYFVLRVLRKSSAALESESG